MGNSSYVALVTGGNRGIGLEVARELAAGGCGTNLFGAIAVAQAFVDGMVQRRYGRVVNVSPRAGQLATMEGCIRSRRRP